MERNPLPEELKRSFDDAVLTITRMQEEAAVLMQKFGSTSKIYKERMTQVDAMRRLYKSSAAYIEHMLDLNIKLGAHCISIEVDSMQRKYDLSFGDAAIVLGYNFKDEHIKTIEAIDRIIANVKRATDEQA